MVSPGPSAGSAAHSWAIWHYYFTGHNYADDTQVYVSTPASDYTDAMDWLTCCIITIWDWMASKRLKLNEDKTLIISLGTRLQLDKITVQNAESAECHCSVFNCCQRSWHSTGQSADHGWSRCCTQSVLLLSHAAASVDKTNTDSGRHKNTDTRFY